MSLRPTAVLAPLFVLCGTLAFGCATPDDPVSTPPDSGPIDTADTGGTPEGLTVLYIGHSFGKPFAEALPDFAEDAGIEGHVSHIVKRGGENGAPQALWDDDEAREVLERMDRMAAEGASSGDSDADSEDEMELDLTNAPVRLAENGYELLVTRDDGTRVRIGPRELRRYYKQRPRPDDDRAMVLAARANEEARGMARLGETRAGERGLAAFDASGKFSLPHISIMVKRAQKAARKYERSPTVLVTSHSSIVSRTHHGGGSSGLALSAAPWVSRSPRCDSPLGYLSSVSLGPAHPRASSLGAALRFVTPTLDAGIPIFLLKLAHVT